MIFLYAILTYMFIVFVLLRLIVPNLNFKTNSIPQNIPKEFENEIQKLNKNATSDEHFLFLAHEYVTNKYKGNRLKTVTQFWKAFENPFEQRSGFMHCMGQNYILRTMLIKSGRFRPEQVRVVTTNLNIFIHQRLDVLVENCVIPVDPWAHFLGVRPGQKVGLFK